MSGLVEKRWAALDFHRRAFLPPKSIRGYPANDIPPLNAAFRYAEDLTAFVK